MLQRETTRCIGQDFDCGLAARVSAMHIAAGSAFDRAREDDTIAVKYLLTLSSQHYSSVRC